MQQIKAPESGDRPGQYIILFALWLLIFSASSQIIIIAPILPVIGVQLDMPEHLQGLLITAYAVMVGVFALLVGPVSDKIGRRRILLIGTAAMALALGAHGMVKTWEQLLLMRSLAGVAGGLLSGSAVSYVGDYFPVERRGWASGWIMSGAATGQIIGIPLGTIMAEYFGFRLPFLMFGVTMMMTFYLVWAYVPQPDVRLSTQELTIRNAIRNYRNLLIRREVFAATFAFFMMFSSIGLFVVYFPTWLQSTYGVSGDFIASLFLVGGVANVIFGPQAGRLSDRIGRKWLVIVSCIGTSLLLVVSTFVIYEPWVAYPYFFLLMVLVAMRVSPFQALLTEIVDADRRGSLLSINAAMGQAGLGIGGAIAGLFYTDFGFLSNSLMGAVAIMITALLIWKMVPESAHFSKTSGTPQPAVPTDA